MGKRVLDLTVKDIEQMYPYASEEKLEAFLREAQYRAFHRRFDDIIFEKIRDGIMDIEDLTLNDLLIPPPKKEHATFEQIKNMYPDASNSAIDDFVHYISAQSLTMRGIDNFSKTSVYPKELLLDKTFFGTDNMFIDVVYGMYDLDTDCWYSKMLYESNPSIENKKTMDSYAELSELCKRVINDQISAFNNHQLSPNKTQDMLQEMPQSPKALKSQIEKSLSEFKSQQRDYYAKWEEWRGVKEEWLNLAMDEDNLSQRAEWSVEACQRQVLAAVQQTINAGIDKAASTYSAREIYAALQPTLDPDGYYISGAAEKLTGFNVESEYPVEDNLHYFEAMNGFGRLRFLEAAKFGERSFTPIQAWTETVDKYIIHSDTPQFKAYQDSIFTEALADMKRSAALTSDIKECISATTDFKSIGTAELISSVSPQKEWVNLEEHMKSYAVSLRSSDEESWYKGRYQEVTGTDYRVYETFHQPDDKIPTEPAFDISLPQETRTDKLLNIFRPERETPRLQTELKILTNNISAMRNFGKLLDKSILEMKGEIAEMQVHAVKAAQEIQSGKHFNEWMKLNLKPELKALGLDAEKASFQELMNKLSQNVAAPPHMQEEALAIE